MRRVEADDEYESDPVGYNHWLETAYHLVHKLKTMPGRAEQALVLP